MVTQQQQQQKEEAAGQVLQEAQVKRPLMKAGEPGRRGVKRPHR